MLCARPPLATNSSLQWSVRQVHILGPCSTCYPSNIEGRNGSCSGQSVSKYYEVLRIGFCSCLILLGEAPGTWTTDPSFKSRLLRTGRVTMSEGRFYYDLTDFNNNTSMSWSVEISTFATPSRAVRPTYIQTNSADTDVHALYATLGTPPVGHPTPRPPRLAVRHHQMPKIFLGGYRSRPVHAKARGDSSIPR